ncbi:MAG: type II toxin-antitoxin system VapC family toxin [Puniceicoccales bacterium]
MEATHLLDTSVYSQVLRPKPNQACIGRWENLGDQAICVSSICIGELEFGLELKDSEKLWARYRQILLGRFVVVDFDARVASVFARIKAQQQRIGKPVDDFDLSIAACAVTYDLTLVTLNARHFSLIDGLTWEDWSQP